jgi:hypothetical protein
MMYYSELLQQPVTEEFCKRQFGINPNGPAHEVRERGFYPLIEAPEGYTATHYIKEGDHYRAVVLPISDAEVAAVHKLRKHGGVEKYALEIETTLYD